MSHFIDLSLYSENVMRGLDDAGALLNDILTNKVPDNKLDWQSSGTVEIYIPPFHRGAPTDLQFATMVTPTGQRNFVVRSDADWGARLTNNTGENQIFQFSPGSVGRVIQFHNLAFWQGGVEVVGANRGPIIFKGNIFNETPGPAIHFVDEDEATGALNDGDPGTETGVGIVGAIIDGNFFQQCAGSMWLMGSTHEVGKVYNNRSLNCEAVPLRINGPGWRIENNDFQTVRMDVATAVNGAFVWLENNQSAGEYRPQDHGTTSIWFYGNRFGSESPVNYDPTGLTDNPATISGTYGVPKHGILIGDETAPNRQPFVGGMYIDKNEFFGRNQATGGAANDEALYAVSIYDRPNGIVFGAANQWRNYRSALIGEHWATAGGTHTSLRNLFLANVGITNDNEAFAGGYPLLEDVLPDGIPLFSEGGYSWRKPFIGEGLRLQTTTTASGAGGQQDWVIDVLPDGASNIGDTGTVVARRRALP